MKPKFSEYERRQIQAMMRKQMPNRKNLKLWSDGRLTYEIGCEGVCEQFDLYGVSAAAAARWTVYVDTKTGPLETRRFTLRKRAAEYVNAIRYDDSVMTIVVTDNLKGPSVVIRNTLPTAMQLADLIDTFDCVFHFKPDQMGVLLHIAYGFDPHRWNSKPWNVRLNRMKLLWRYVAKMIGQFHMSTDGYSIFKENAFDGHFVGFGEK